MDDERGKKGPVEPAAHVPTERELAVLHAIHQMTDRVVLVPVYINGQPRIALALLSKSETGQPYVQVLANLLQPTDEVLDSRGCPGYNKTPPARNDLN